MPIRPENRARYPKNWPNISKRIRARAQDMCEECGVKNHAIGGRAVDGTFLPALPLGDNGLKLIWPRQGQNATCRLGERREVLRIMRIILTVAHLDHTPENCGDDNLMALCQRCHNRLDAKMRRAGIIARSRENAAIGELWGGANAG